MRGPDQINAMTLAPLQVGASGANFGYALRLDADHALVLQGDAGYSRKSQRGQASYYYSQPFFKVTGQLTIDDRAIEVTGQAWMDREWSSQPLAPDQSGWDWFSLHLNSGEKLMLFRLRQTDGSSYCSGNWILPEGKSEQILPTGNQLDADGIAPTSRAEAADGMAHRHPLAPPFVECTPLNPAKLDGDELSLLGRTDPLSGQPRRRRLSRDDRLSSSFATLEPGPGAPLVRQTNGLRPCRSRWYNVRSLAGHVNCMTLILIIVAAIGIVWLAERSAEHFELAMAAQCLIAAVLLFVVGDLERAILLSSFLALAVFGASSVKYNHSGSKTRCRGFAAGVRRHGAVLSGAISAGGRGCRCRRRHAHPRRRRRTVSAGTRGGSGGSSPDCSALPLIGLVVAYRSSGGAVCLAADRGAAAVFPLELSSLRCSTRFPGDHSAGSL